MRTLCTRKLMSIIQEIADAWGRVGINPVEVVGENDFGNLIVKDADEKYWRLCPEEVYFEIIAEDRESLDKLSTDQEFLEDWYMAALVELAIKNHGQLEQGKKFHLTVPSILGGEYAIENIKQVPLIEQIRFSGSVGKQINELPDGAQIELKVVS